MFRQTVVTKVADGACRSVSAVFASCSNRAGSLVNRANVASAARTNAAHRAASRPCPTTSPTTMVVLRSGPSTTRKKSPATSPSAGRKDVASCRWGRGGTSTGISAARSDSSSASSARCAWTWRIRRRSRSSSHATRTATPKNTTARLKTAKRNSGPDSPRGRREHLVDEEREHRCSGGEQATAQGGPEDAEHEGAQAVQRHREAGLGVESEQAEHGELQDDQDRDPGGGPGRPVAEGGGATGPAGQPHAAVEAATRASSTLTGAARKQARRPESRIRADCCRR